MDKHIFETSYYITYYVSDDNHIEETVKEYCDMFHPELFDLIKIKYTEKHRKYHDLKHICFLLTAYRMAFNFVNHSFQVHYENLISILFHDIIYEPLNNDNEEKSVEEFIVFLKKLDDNISTYINSDIVKYYIMTTKIGNNNHSTLKAMDNWIVNSCNDEEYLLDYENRISKEYLQFYPKEQYYVGRKEFIENRLEKNPNLKVILDKLDEKYKSSTL